MQANILTKVLVLSDTHGKAINTSTIPPVDVVIHCGDLTEESKLDEFRTTIDLLKSLPAPLKLVIAGNHDFTLDVPWWRERVASSGFQDDPLIVREFGDYGEAGRLWESAAEAGIVLLHEGTHHFELQNGASLTVYASPYTAHASTTDWGFAYAKSEDHRWAIQPGTDVVITHSPPRGILDFASARERIGSESLFAAIATARPLLHCFGHAHQGWGAKLIHWRDTVADMQKQANALKHLDDDTPRLRTLALSAFTTIDNDKSAVIETVATLEAGRFDDAEKIRAKHVKFQSYRARGHCSVNRPPQAQAQTLFVNAAIKIDDERQRLPWIVEVKLPMAATFVESRAGPS